MLVSLIILYTLTTAVLGQTCSCDSETISGTGVCVETQNGCTGTNEICTCSAFSASSSSCNPGNPRDCIGADAGSPSSNTCTCHYSTTHNACVTADVGTCSEVELCLCSKRDQTLCASTPGPCAAVGELGAFGDPHFFGLDQRKFDFHGVHGNSYLVYAEVKGDVLTAKVRATPELYNGYNKTYFHEFGLQVFGSNNKIHFFLDQVAPRHWAVHVTVNFKHISSDVKLKNCELLFNADGTSVTIVTKKNKFSIKGVSLSSKFRRHLDFKLKKGPIVKSDRYGGVLGMTLSRRFGSSIHEEVIGRGREKQFEMKMRQHYGLKDIFPSRSQIAHMF